VKLNARKNPPVTPVLIIFSDGKIPVFFRGRSYPTFNFRQRAVKRGSEYRSSNFPRVQVSGRKVVGPKSRKDTEPTSWIKRINKVCNACSYSNDTHASYVLVSLPVTVNISDFRVESEREMERQTSSVSTLRTLFSV